MQRRRRNRIQISRDIICLFLSFIFVLLYYKSHFGQTCHLYSGEMSKRHLDRERTCDRERSGTIIFLVSFLVAALLLCKGDGGTEFKFQETSFAYFCHSYLYYCTTNLILDRHVISILVRCLKDTSWKIVTDQTTYLLQSHLKFPHEC